MERLTIRNSDGSVSQPTDTTVEAVFYRLAAYEDTMPLERAQELSKAEKDGVNDTEVFETALKTWGADAQTVMVFEEMSELQKELCKHARGKENVEQIAEEIADVQIMLEQMIVLHNCGDAVKEYRRSKVERLKIRLGIKRAAIGSCMEAVDRSKTITITPPPNDPLTLEELREMDGEPVWMQSLDDGYGEWVLFQQIDLGDSCTFAVIGATRNYYDGYGKTWIAYRRKPEDGTV